MSVKKSPAEEREEARKKKYRKCYAELQRKSLIAKLSDAERFLEVRHGDDPEYARTLSQIGQARQFLQSAKTEISETRRDSAVARKGDWKDAAVKIFLAVCDDPNIRKSKQVAEAYSLFCVFWKEQIKKKGGVTDSVPPVIGHFREALKKEGVYVSPREKAR